MYHKKIINEYTQFQANAPKLFDQRALQIIQKAKVYGVDMFANESLAQELFSLKFDENINEVFIKSLLDMYTLFDGAIEKAQQSI